MTGKNNKLAMKFLLMIVMTLCLILSIATTGFAADNIKGTVTKIDGSTITVKTADGKELTGKSVDATINVGDRVFVSHGKVSRKRMLDRH